MERRRTLTMTWDGLGDDDDDDQFFDSNGRVSSAVSFDAPSSGSGSDEDEDGFEDARVSFSSGISSASIRKPSIGREAFRSPMTMFGDFNMWTSQPGSITERRKKLLQGMGIASNKSLLKLTSAKILQAPTRKVENYQPTPAVEPTPPAKEEPKQDQTTSSSNTIIRLVRSRSDGDIDTFSIYTKRRKEELIGTVSKQRLTRTSSMLLTPKKGLVQFSNSFKESTKRFRNRSSGKTLSNIPFNGGLGSFFLIKNLDTGTEFIVKESNEEGMWNKFRDLQTGKQLTMEEFEKSVAYSPVVKELMSRQKKNSEDGGKISANSYLSRSFRNSKRMSASFFRNIKGVANGLMGEKESTALEQQSAAGKNTSSPWVKVHQSGKTYKEFSALYMCQEIQAHEGSIWTIRFSSDSHYLASAGEDTVIHVWEVQECEVMKPTDDLNSSNTTPLHPMASGGASDRPHLAEITPMPSQRKRRNRKKGSSIPDYVQVPETVFGLSEKPVCSFRGHAEDILDLSWSRSQLLLSSSMDKTVRLWDMETESCLKLFAHSDYVTCIQFNPIDDDYFISGSLDEKVRIWNITGRKVVDWTDLHEMVTAASYTPDGKGAVVGSHKGICHMYTVEDSKMEQKENLETRNKRKSMARKITGLEFAPWNQSDLLITSADSRIRIFDGSEFTNKFTGFRNTSSQIAGSFSPDGTYVICASEDSQVYIWKREDARSTGAAKTKTLIKNSAYEHFQCQDVSVAIPWLGSIKNEPPTVEFPSRRHIRRSIEEQPSATGSPIHEDSGSAGNSKSHLPPLPKKNNAAALERTTSCQEDSIANSLRADPSVGASELVSGSSSIRYGDSSPSISSAANSHGSNTLQATAWGLVIVTASQGGEIRVYQNFGLPFKAGLQATLFKDLT